MLSQVHLYATIEIPPVSKHDGIDGRKLDAVALLMIEHEIDSKTRDVI